MLTIFRTIFHWKSSWKKKNVPWFLLYAWAKGDFFFFLKTCSPGNHTANKGQVSFFIVIGIGLELKSRLSPSLRSYCGIYSNHPSCLPTTQLNGTPKKYLSREKATTYFLNSHCFYSSTWKYLFFEKKIIKLTQLLPLFIFQ